MPDRRDRGRVSEAPTFSVIVPLRDAAPFVAEAIASVQAQTAADWELIVVDDGSEDGGAGVVARVREPRLRLLRQENAGALAARRAGLAVARGDLVVFLDADDRLRPDALARFRAALAGRSDVAVAYGDRVLVDREGRPFGDERGALLAPRPSGDVLERILARSFLSTPGQACVRRAALADAPSWDTGVRRMGDWYAWCAVACRGRFAYLGRGPVVEYRMHPGSMARSLAERVPPLPSIDELRPAIDAAFALPGVVRRLPPARRDALRRRCEAGAFAWKGQELLRLSRFAESRAYFAEALRRHLSVVDLLCFALAVAGVFPPGVRRWIGQFDAGESGDRDRRRA